MKLFPSKKDLQSDEARLAQKIGIWAFIVSNIIIIIALGYQVFKYLAE